MKEEKKEPKTKKPVLLRTYSQDFKAYIVYLRYGSLKEPGPRCHIYNQIKEIAGIRQTRAY